MILGYGVDRSGAMTHPAGFITGIAGTNEWKRFAVVTAAAGASSAFMQNIGSAVLFLPSLRMISRTFEWRRSPGILARDQ